MRVFLRRAMALLLLGFAACGARPDPGASTAVTRIVSLSPALTDCVVYLGAADRLVGISASCAAALAGCDSTTIVGEEYEPDTGAILALAPHLVLVSTRMDETTRRSLESAGTKVAALPEPASLQEVSNNILAVGALVGDPAGAAAKAHEWQVEISGLLRHFGDTTLRRPRAFLLVHAPGPWTTGPRTCMGEIAEGLGLENTYEGGYQLVTTSAAAAREPELILSLCGEEGRTPGIELQGMCSPRPRIIEVESWRELRISGPSLLAAIRRLREKPELSEVLP